MTSGYDMCVDYNTLCTIEEKLQKIEYGLNNSTQKMIDAIQRSHDFLSGSQYEKAKNTTLKCLEITGNTGVNIKNARDYINKLILVLEEYERCDYRE